MTKEDGYTAPPPVRKFFGVDFRAMMYVHDEAIHADAQEMIHRVGDDGTSSDLQERLGTSLRQRPKPHPQPGAQDKGCLEPASFQRHLTSRSTKKNELNGVLEKWNIGILGRCRLEVKKTELGLVFPFLVCPHYSILSLFHSSKSLCFFLAELRVNFHQRRHDEPRYRRGHDPEEKVWIAQ